MTKREAEVYIFIGKRGPQKGGQIAKQLKKHSAQIYRILRRLKKKGLIESTLEAPTRFTAVPFEKILDLFIKTKQGEYLEPFFCSCSDAQSLKSRGQGRNKKDSNDGLGESDGLFGKTLFLK